MVSYKGMADAVGMLQSLDVVLNLRAGKPGGKRTVGIAPQRRSAVFTPADNQGACVRAIHGTGGYSCAHEYLGRFNIC